MNRDDFVGYAVPALTLGLGLFAWEGLVRYFDVPSYLLPAPSLIIATLFTERMGNLMLVGCVLWMSVGIFVMKKMISFDF